MRLLLLFFFSLYIVGCQSQLKTSNARMNIPKNFDWQGHRGARGLLPENTIPAFLKALEYPIQTLELDLAVTKDGQLLVSHEPWLSHHICSNPDGSPVTEEQEKKLIIFQLTYAQIQKYDCGSRGNARFPEQQPLNAAKPLLSHVLDTVEAHCKKTGRRLPFYNIEIKSQVGWDGIYTPPVATFAQLLIDQIKAAGIQNRVCIQSFDARALQAVHQIDAGLTTAFLIENSNGFEKNMDQLNFKPDIYSPYYQLVNGKLVQQVHQQNMRLIPWTVNDTASMRQLIMLGVDGIITDYPNLILTIEK